MKITDTERQDQGGHLTLENDNITGIKDKFRPGSQLGLKMNVTGTRDRFRGSVSP